MNEFSYSCNGFEPMETIDETNNSVFFILYFKKQTQLTIYNLFFEVDHFTCR